jgi:serine/threonine protein kinase
VKTIHVISSVSTGLDAALPVKATLIQVPDNPFGHGGFGIAYKCDRFDGQKVPPQVVKLLTGNPARRGFDTIRELQKRLRAENAKAGGQLLRKYPALYGVPQLSFEGELDGQKVLGYSANDLLTAGFEEFGRILGDPAKYAAFQRLPIPAKMKMASELVSAFQFLSAEVRFIHADIKAEALFLDVSGSHCAIIDFDSGALARDANDKPSTFGTKQDWLAPEIVRQLDQSGNTKRIIKVDLQSDIWSINVAIHYLLFGIPPLFFLSEISDRSIDAYLNRFQWPDADASFQYFERSAASAYKKYRSFARKAVRPEMIKRLAATFTAGYRNPAQRTSYGQWQLILGSLHEPRIRSFTPDRTFIDDGRPVHLTWDVTGALKVEITGHGDVTRKTSIDVNVTDDTTFQLILTAASGQTLIRTATVKVDKRPPQIHDFTTSASPLMTARPARLTWNVERAARIQIDQGIGDVTLYNSVEALPRTATRYTLTATSFFGITATAFVDIAVNTMPPVIRSFRASPARLERGESVMLTWDVSADAHEVSITGIGRVEASGSRVVDQRRRQVYVLHASTYFGKESESMIEVDILDPPPVIRKFKVTPPLVQLGDEVTLTWNVSGAEHVRLDGAEVAADGVQAIRPGRATRFHLRATSWYGSSVERNAIVVVVGPKTIDDLRAATAERKRRLWRGPT